VTPIELFEKPILYDSDWRGAISMPIGTDDVEPNEIIRTLTVIRGEIRFKMWCKPRFNYGMCNTL
jgi:hypothetical protein